jgi:hypothetical protein
MSPSLRFVVLVTILMITSAAFAQPTIVNFDFGAVRILCGADYAYQASPTNCTLRLAPQQDFNSAPGFGWTLTGGYTVFCCSTALTGPGTSFQPPPFGGLPFTQAVALQGKGSDVSQVVGGFTAGNYTLSFYLDGNVIGSWALSSYTPFTLETAKFPVSTDGSHKVEFKGLNYGDHTAFVSYVTITSD